MEILKDDINKYPSDRPSQVVSHDCNDIRTKVYSWNDKYSMTRCGMCDKILEFKWHSIWKRIKSIF